MKHDGIQPRARRPGSRGALTFSALVFVGACNVDAPQVSTGGAHGEACERFAIVRSDYTSTQVSLVDDRGAATSANVVSSGTEATGATSALSGDVVLPHDPPASGELVLIDRYPNGILTWIDAASGAVAGQLNVVPGFASNPHDYLEIAPDKAYVTRFETNRAPGRVPFDEGGDILVIDPSRRTLSKRIDLAAYGGAVDPRPERMTLGKGRVYLTLARLDAAFEQAEDGLVVVVDVGADTVVDTLAIRGLKNCTNLALSPDGRSLAVTCSGVFRVPGAAQLATSGVVVLDLESKQERLRVTASTLGAPLASAIGFATNDALVTVAFGDPGDKVIRIDVGTGEVATLHNARESFTLGELSCGCGERCLLASAEAMSLLAVDATDARPLALLGGSSLPPRSVGAVGRTKGSSSAP